MVTRLQLPGAGNRNQNVTGPSFTSATFMSAPKRPGRDLAGQRRPWRARRPARTVVGPTSGAAAVVKLGPQALARVGRQRELGDQQQARHRCPPGCGSCGPRRPRRPDRRRLARPGAGECLVVIGLDGNEGQQARPDICPTTSLSTRTQALGDPLYEQNHPKNSDCLSPLSEIVLKETARIFRKLGSGKSQTICKRSFTWPNSAF